MGEGFVADGVKRAAQVPKPELRSSMMRRLSIKRTAYKGAEKSVVGIQWRGKTNLVGHSHSGRMTAYITACITASQHPAQHSTLFTSHHFFLHPQRYTLSTRHSNMTSDDERFEDAESDTPQVDQWELERAQKVQEAISNSSDEAKAIDAIAEIRGWFSPSADSIFYAAVQEYLDDKLDLTEAERKISGHIDKASSEKEEGIDFMDLWYSVLHSAKRISFRNATAHDKLIELLGVIEKHPNINGLPYLGMAVREAWNDCPGVGAGFSVPEIHAFANFNYFLARLTKEQVMEFWIYVIWAMRSALEDVFKDDGPDDAHVPATAIQKYDANIPAASAWVLIMGKEIYRKEEDLTPKSKNEGNPAKGGELWAGRPEFSKDRWVLWKKRFQEISQMQEIAEDTRKSAKEAFDAMEQELVQ
ncbi:hypothetical protein P154DRAFT_530882 [Amniculicola lignicola CBS 123094]|uniref:Uncharacterized protein n=1 Tax=Amniculicola lignicola CBS 123094 TaxID=1392246 RepID=A0A6A5X2C3_9PLEO|nr:hypothetical protein P154DRAFT_530882 [Amniculicola lignicola CBS 123094]